MVIREKAISTAVIAWRLALCPGDDIFMSVAGAMKTAEVGDGMPPAAFLYEKSPVIRVKGKSSKGDEALEPIPDETQDILIVDFSELEAEALNYSPQELEALNV